MISSMTPFMDGPLRDLFDLQEDEADDDDDAESESLISRVRHASSNSNSNREGEQRAGPAADESVIIESPKADKDASAPAEDSIIVLDSSSEDLLAKRRSNLYVRVHTVV